jgi:hypothetical protein
MANEVADALADAATAITALVDELAAEAIQTQEGARLRKAAMHAASALVPRGAKGVALEQLAVAEDGARV